MFEIDGRKLCSECFKPVHSEQECDICELVEKKDYPMALMPETILQGKFVVGKTVFYDDTCFTYIAYNISSGERVLIKEFFPVYGDVKRNSDGLMVDVDSETTGYFEENKEKFYNATQIASSLNNVNEVTPILELFNENNTAYSVAYLPDNATLLSDYSAIFGKKLGEAQSLKVFEKIITALDVIHKKGFIHGNIRPENIILEGERVMFAGMENGFFLTNRESTEFSVALQRVYSAPELFTTSEKYSFASDIYSLGATLFNIVTGKDVACSMERFETSEEGVVLDETGVSAKLKGIILKSLALNPSERFQNLFELCKAMKKEGLSKIALKRTKEKNIKEESYGIVHEKKGKKKLVVIIAICAFIVAVATTVFFVKGCWTNSKSPEESVILNEEVENTDNVQDEPITEESEEISPEKDSTDISSGIDVGNPKEKDSKRWWENYMLNTERIASSQYVFNNKNYLREEIVSVEFHNTMSNVKKKSWDISKEHDGSVKAWIEQAGDRRFRLHIAADGGINGVDSANSLFLNYVNLSSVSFNDSFHTDLTTDTSYMFKNCRKLKQVDLENIKTLNVTDMTSMFENCTSLSELKFTSFTTGNVVSMKNMFNNCSSLKKLDLDIFSTIKVEDMSGMFAYCSRLETLTLNNFKTPNIRTAEKMFYKCSRLKALNISGFSVTDDVNISKMFDGCPKLKDVIINNERLKNAYNKTKKS